MYYSFNHTKFGTMLTLCKEMPVRASDCKVYVLITHLITDWSLQCVHRFICPKTYDLQLCGKT